MGGMMGSRAGMASVRRTQQGGMMGRQTVIALYVLALVAVVVSVDVLLFKNRFWERLMVNVGIVLVFAAFYLRFLNGP
jgi:cell division protein FtsW (lipid II flippase)